jgi:predicted RNase H-like HicB family nuclease
MKSIIYGYYFAILIEKGEFGYKAYAPGVGGVYEEGKTTAEAEANGYAAACAILETRSKCNDPIVKNNKYLKIITAPPTSESIDKFKQIMPSGYIATTPCALSV